MLISYININRYTRKLLVVRRTVLLNWRLTWGFKVVRIFANGHLQDMVDYDELHNDDFRHLLELETKLLNDEEVLDDGYGDSYYKEEEIKKEEEEEETGIKTEGVKPAAHSSHGELPEDNKVTKDEKAEEKTKDLAKEEAKEDSEEEPKDPPKKETEEEPKEETKEEEEKDNKETKEESMEAGYEKKKKSKKKRRRRSSSSGSLTSSRYRRTG